MPKQMRNLKRFLKCLSSHSKSSTISMVCRCCCDLFDEILDDFLLFGMCLFPEDFLRKINNPFWVSPISEEKWQFVLDVKNTHFTNENQRFFSKVSSSNNSRKTPEGRSATFGVQGLGVFFSFFVDFFLIFLLFFSLTMAPLWAEGVWVGRWAQEKVERKQCVQKWKQVTGGERCASGFRPWRPPPTADDFSLHFSQKKKSNFRTVSVPLEAFLFFFLCFFCVNTNHINPVFFCWR